MLNQKFLSVLEKIRTPNKLGKLVLSPSFKRNQFDSHAVDCPFVFKHNDRYYMTYEGWDTIGYRTGLASSDDLISWQKEGMIIDRGPAGSPTEFNAAMTWIVRDNDLFGSGELKKINGRFLGTYHAYPSPGYESGPAVIGLCWSDDLYNWEIEEPFLRAEEGGEWERGGLYKSCIVEHDGKFYLFYNAKKVNGMEQTGVVISEDLKNWHRYDENPVLKTGPEGSFDDWFVSDPCVLRCDDVWVMFFYTFSRTDGRARNSAAFSTDLLNWEKSGEILIDTGEPGSIDYVFAHKPGIITKDGKVYHFYCAVSHPENPRQGEIENRELRGISVAVN